MSPRDDVVKALRARGELWDVAPGVTALRGDAAELLRALERAIAALCGLETADDWRVPPAIDFATLARAEYFASFPHWLTLASHLSDDDESLRRVAEHGDSPAVVHEASAPPQAASRRHWPCLGCRSVRAGRPSRRCRRTSCRK